MQVSCSLDISKKSSWSKTNSKADDCKRISCTLSGFVVATHIPVPLQPIHHLLHLEVPIGPKDDQTADDAGQDQSDGETDPKTPKFHILFEGEVDARWNADNIIGTKTRKFACEIV